MFNSIEEIEDVTDTEDVVSSEDKPFRPTKYQASYIWWLGEKCGIIGKTAPATSKGEGSREKLRYECLLPDATATEYINKKIAWAMPPISTETWKGICKRYRHQPSPYEPPEYDTSTPSEKLKKSNQVG